MCLFRKEKPLSEYKTIETLDINNRFCLSLQMRESIRVCIIDDEKYPLDGFKKLGYKNVSVHEKAGDLADYSEYQIILCDIRGVGTEYSNNEEGLAFAKQLKKMYPLTEIYIFTGQNVQNFGKTDGIEVIKKPKSSAQLASYFDSSLKRLCNPIFLWQKISSYLIENNIKPKDQVIIEDNFVEAVKHGKQFSLNNVSKTAIQQTNLDVIARFVGVLLGSFTKEICSQ